MKRTGMEPWIEFWKQVRYAFKELRIEWLKFQEYEAAHPSTEARD